LPLATNHREVPFETAARGPFITNALTSSLVPDSIGWTPIAGRRVKIAITAPL